MKKLLILVGALVALVLTPQAAVAEPTDPLVRGTVEVEVSGNGRVTGSGIDCPETCMHSNTWRESEMPPTNRLTATPGTGWAFGSWDGCTVVPTDRTRCDATYAEMGGVVYAGFVDVAAPNVALTSPAAGAVVNQTVNASVNTSDNDRVIRVQYLIDGNVVATVSQAPWSASIDVSGLGAGNHTIAARSHDPAGNVGTSAANTFVVDRTAPDISFNDPALATNEATPLFSFTSAAPDFRDAACVIQRQGEDRPLVACQRDTWFSGDAPSEGEWEFVVRLRDHVFNEAVYRHTFTVDRTAPVLAFTAGPADGSVVDKGNVRYEWSVTDGLPTSQLCSWDGGQPTVCEGFAARGLTRGNHSFKVVVTDLAGNSSELTRTVSVKEDGDLPGDPDPNDPKPNDPKPKDTKAPVVKLKVVKQKYRALKRNLRVRVRCSEGCSGRIVARAAGGIRFTGKVKRNAAGAVQVRLKPNAKAKRALRKKRPAMRVTVVANLADRAGNATRATAKGRIRA